MYHSGEVKLSHGEESKIRSGFKQQTFTFHPSYISPRRHNSKVSWGYEMIEQPLF